MYIAHSQVRTSDECFVERFQAYWLRDAPTGKTLKNFTFCHNVFMCFVFISEQIVAFAPYNIN
jgi:hypothetical protein